MTVNDRILVAKLRYAAALLAEFNAVYELPGDTGAWSPSKLIHEANYLVANP